MTSTQRPNAKVWVENQHGARFRLVEVEACEYNGPIVWIENEDNKPDGIPVLLFIKYFRVVSWQDNATKGEA